MNRALVALAAVAALSSGCGKPTFASTCRQAAQVQCRRLFKCTPTLAMTAYASEQDCATRYEAAINCAQYDNLQCDADFSQYEKCLSDTDHQDCGTAGQPASCTNATPMGTCTSGGKATCTASDANTQGNTCTVVISNCTDGRNYGLSCANGVCTCSVSGTTSSTYSGSSCGDKNAAIRSCNFAIQ